MEGPGSKDAQDDNNDLEEVANDGGPHVAEEVEHLALQCADLWMGGGKYGQIRQTIDS